MRRSGGIVPNTGATLAATAGAVLSSAVVSNSEQGPAIGRWLQYQFYQQQVSGKH
jgi:hypothetical protein